MIAFQTPKKFQTKLKIGSPNDRFEQQADRVADAVVNNPVQPLQMQPREEEKELQMQPVEEEEIQMKQLQSESIQMAPTGRADQQLRLAPAGVSKKISSLKGTGQKLPSHLNREMSRKIGADFSDVSIHKGKEATSLSNQIGARAFTHGKDIYFNSGEFKPDSSEGKHLLAHELTHVVQQNTGNSNLVNKDQLYRQTPDTQTRENEEIGFEFPGITRMMTRTESQLHLAAFGLTQPHFYATMQTLLAASATMDITIGVGVQLEGAAVAGIVGSAGYVINDGRIGLYGSYGADLGAVIGASAELVFTVIDGGLDKFSGPAVAAVFGGGELIVGHMSLIMPVSGGGMLGVSLSGGVGIGLTPVEAYLAITNTHAPAN